MASSYRKCLTMGVTGSHWMKGAQSGLHSPANLRRHRVSPKLPLECLETRCGQMEPSQCISFRYASSKVGRLPTPALCFHCVFFFSIVPSLLTLRAQTTTSPRWSITIGGRRDSDLTTSWTHWVSRPSGCRCQKDHWAVKQSPPLLSRAAEREHTLPGLLW